MKVLTDKEVEERNAVMDHLAKAARVAIQSKISKKEFKNMALLAFDYESL